MSAAQPLQMAVHSRMGAARGALSKAGARNSGADQSRVQKVHDTAVELGAACGGAQKAMPGGALEKKFDALAATLADVLQRVKQIEVAALAVALRRTGAGDRARMRTPALDPRGTTRSKSFSLDPEALSILAIKLAQRNGRAPMR